VKRISQRLLSKFGGRWALTGILTLAAALLILGVFPSTLIDSIDQYAYDVRMRVEQPVLDPRIVIVDIDERSLAEVGRWPWSRNVVAEFITSLTERYRVRSVSFDVVFAEEDTSSGYGILEALAKGELKDIATYRKRIEALKPTLDYDARMAKSMKDWPVVLGFYLSNEQTAFQKGLLPPPAFTASDLNGYSIDATLWNAYSANLAGLQRAARGGGFINPTPDTDGVIRRIPLLARMGDGYYESLALASARVALGATNIRPVFLSREETLMSEQDLRQYGVLKAIELNSMPRAVRIPVERSLTALIRYRGKGGPDSGAFRYVSAVDVLKGRLKPDELADRVILVGTTVAGLKDLRASPVAVDYPGVEVHATMISSILDGDFKHEPDFSVGFELLQVLVLGIVLGLVLPALAPVFSMLVTMLTAAAVIALNFWMYQSLNLVMPMAAALLLIFSLFVVNITRGYLFEYRKGRAIVNLFGEYVAPELVAEMAEDPQRYNMQGESRELTVLFADVRGFTTISESLDPNVLREYINRYLTAMSENIRGNRGTLDKYIGDAVMAFWGAPVALPDHASRAVATALAMQRSAQALNKDFIARGWPALHIGIGLNTGLMRVGDMGSKIRRAYTVIGDAVNLGARLEGITKVYGVGVIVGEATRLAAPGFAYRELDRVRVKGRCEPVPIYEPVGLEQELPGHLRNAIGRWHEALALVRARRWDQAEHVVLELYARYPDDGAYRLYLQRIARFREDPPGEDWDGVATFESK
jgi:adenylate cyclase